MARTCSMVVKDSDVKRSVHFKRLAAKVAGLSFCAVVALGGLTGCESSDKVDSDLSRQAQELRQRNASLEVALKDKDAQMAKMQADNDSLTAQLNEARNAASRVPAEPAPKTAGSTGFEGIDGVDSSRNRRGEIVVDVAGDVLFDPGSIVLKPTARKTLDRVASVIESRYASNTIRVAGHTDSDPIVKTATKYKDNEELSAQRALAVERYLISRGVSGDKVYAAAYGASQPKGSKSASRRVEIVILTRE